MDRPAGSISVCLWTYGTRGIISYAHSHDTGRLYRMHFPMIYTAEIITVCTFSWYGRWYHMHFPKLPRGRELYRIQRACITWCILWWFMWCLTIWFIGLCYRSNSMHIRFNGKAHIYIIMASCIWDLCFII